MPISIRVTHSGLYADGRPNTSSVQIKDLDFGFEYQNRKQTAYVPAGGFIVLPYTDKSAYSFYQGDIFKFTVAGVLTSELLLSGALDYSPTIASSIGVFPLGTGEIQRYDSSVLAPNSVTLLFPLAPNFNDAVAVKEVGDSAVSVVLDGNGFFLEAPGLSPAAAQNLNIALVSVSFKFDGSVWRIL